MKSLDELDRLAADKVMGWHQAMFSFSSHDPFPVWHDESNKFVSKPEYWQPTRNIAQAYELLEKFEKFTVMKFELPHIGKYRAQVNDDLLTSGETAAEAIVKACLKAKGINIDE